MIELLVGLCYGARDKVHIKTQCNMFFSSKFQEDNETCHGILESNSQAVIVCNSITCRRKEPA